MSPSDGDEHPAVSEPITPSSPGRGVFIDLQKHLHNNYQWVPLMPRNAAPVIKQWMRKYSIVSGDDDMPKWNDKRLERLRRKLGIHYSQLNYQSILKGIVQFLNTTGREWELRGYFKKVGSEIRWANFTSRWLEPEWLISEREDDYLPSGYTSTVNVEFFNANGDLINAFDGEDEESTLPRPEVLSTDPSIVTNSAREIISRKDVRDQSSSKAHAGPKLVHWDTGKKPRGRKRIRKDSHGNYEVTQSTAPAHDQRGSGAPGGGSTRPRAPGPAASAQNGTTQVPQNRQQPLSLPRAHTRGNYRARRAQISPHAPVAQRPTIQMSPRSRRLQSKLASYPGGGIFPTDDARSSILAIQRNKASMLLGKSLANDAQDVRNYGPLDGALSEVRPQPARPAPRPGVAPFVIGSVSFLDQVLQRPEFRHHKPAHLQYGLRDTQGDSPQLSEQHDHLPRLRQATSHSSQALQGVINSSAGEVTGNAGNQSHPSALSGRSALRGLDDPFVESAGTSANTAFVRKLKRARGDELDDSDEPDEPVGSDDSDES